MWYFNKFILFFIVMIINHVILCQFIVDIDFMFNYGRRDYVICDILTNSVLVFIVVITKHVIYMSIYSLFNCIHDYYKRRYFM